MGACAIPRRSGRGGGDLVADAMVAPGRRETTSIVKAGGIDLLDLMKEGLLAPARIVSLARRARPRRDRVERRTGLCASARWSRWRGSPTTPARARASPRWPTRSPSSASPQIRNVATLGGNLLQRPRCWYFRAAEYRCLRKGGGHCFAIHGENHYHAIFDNRLCAIVHPSTAATALVALGASIELVDAEGGKREVRLEDFFVSPDRDVQRENDLRPHEILDRSPTAGAAGERAHGACEDRRKGVLRLAARRCRRAARLRRRTGAARALRSFSAPRRRRRIGRSPPRPRSSADASTRASAGAAGRAALDGAQPLAGNAYKLPLFETAVRRAILKAVAPVDGRMQRGRRNDDADAT